MNLPTINSEIIQKAIEQSTPVQTVEYYPKTPSTMDEAKRGAVLPSLHIAEVQTQTRGRFRRPYFSRTGEGIYCSLAIVPKKDVEHIPLYTIQAAVAVRNTIEKLTGIQAQIKWVNDLYIGTKKVCGILSEGVANSVTHSIDRIIIGIGLNYSIQDFPIEIQEKATSLFPDGNPSVSREEIIAEIFTEFFRIENTNFLEEYKKHSFVLGKNVEFEKNGIVVSGTAIDITDKGELVVEENGNKHVLNSGEISLKSFF